MLFDRAAGRTRWQKSLQIGAGIIALLSGGAITAVVSALTSSFEMKIVAAASAFLSGIISLLTTTLFDARETAKMFDGAAHYAGLRDKAQSLYDRRVSLSVNQIVERLDQLRKDSQAVTITYDHLLPNLRWPSFDVTNILDAAKAGIMYISRE